MHGSSVLEALVGPLCSLNRVSLGRLRAAIDFCVCVLASQAGSWLELSQVKQL